MDLYISPDGEKYNDVPVVYKEEHLQMLLDGGTSIKDGALNFLKYLFRNFFDVREHYKTEKLHVWHFSRSVTEIILSSEKLLILEYHITCHFC